MAKIDKPLLTKEKLRREEPELVYSSWKGILYVREKGRVPSVNKEAHRHKGTQDRARNEKTFEVCN